MKEQEQVRIIEVVPYNASWSKECRKEIEKIYNIFGDEIIEAHHIGSTAIPNSYAKPVIDILIGVRDIGRVDDYNEDMSKLGYIAKGEYGIEGRRFFLKGLYNRTHHIHIFKVGSSEIRRHLTFRDYMIAHPEEAKIYGNLKRDLAEEFRYDIDGYCNGKDAYIKDIDKKAEEWWSNK